MSRGNRGVGDGRGHIGIGIGCPFNKQRFIIDIGFRAFRNPGHSAHSLYGIFTSGRFTRQHNGAGPVVNGVGYVGRFSAGGAGVVHHGIQHLCGCYHLLAGSTGLINQFFLDNRDFFQRNFNTQVTAGYHDPIGGLQNGIDVFYALCVFNFGNNTNMVAAQSF